MKKKKRECVREKKGGMRFEFKIANVFMCACKSGAIELYALSTLEKLKHFTIGRKNCYKSCQPCGLLHVFFIFGRKKNASYICLQQAYKAKRVKEKKNRTIKRLENVEICAYVYVSVFPWACVSKKKNAFYTKVFVKILHTV